MLRIRRTVTSVKFSSFVRMDWTRGSLGRELTLSNVLLDYWHDKARQEKKKKGLQLNKDRYFRASHRHTALPVMLFCPACANILLVQNTDGEGQRFSCQT